MSGFEVPVCSAAAVSSFADPAHEFAKCGADLPRVGSKHRRNCKNPELFLAQVLRYPKYQVKKKRRAATDSRRG